MLLNTKIVIECLKIVILITICILIDFKMAVIKIDQKQDSDVTGHLANENVIRENMRNLTGNDSDWSEYSKIK